MRSDDVVHIAQSGLAQAGAAVSRLSPAGSRTDAGDWYRHEIVDPGKQPLLLLLLALIFTFVLIRFSTRMIRRQVRWWPGNITRGSLHVHHMVFGTCAMVAGGIGGFALDGNSPGTEMAAALFGIGMALVLDEFALILHLEDVYWSEAGRTSIDAVILATLVSLLLLLGFSPLGVTRQIEDGETVLRAYAIVHTLLALAFTAVCFLKGKLWTGMIGMLVWPVAAVGTLRLGKPDSPWARWRYQTRPKRMARALARDELQNRRWTSRKQRLWDLIGGAPSAGTAGGTETPDSPGPG